jgi:hypothetical protein
MAFCFYHYPRSPVLLGAFGFVFVFVGWATCNSFPEDAGAAMKVIIFCVMQIIAFVIMAVTVGLGTVLSLISKRNKTFYAENTFTLDEEGFIAESRYGKAELKWAIVQKLARTKNHIFIYVAQYAAHVIPRRAFRDDAEWNEFYAFCKQKAPLA